MEKRFVNRKTGKLLAAAIATAGLAGYGASSSDASLIVDVRAVPTGSGGATGTSASVVVAPGGKSVTLSGVGTENVRFEVFARVSGTDGDINNEALQSLNASFNTAGSVKGNMSLPAGTGINQMGPQAPFRDSGFQNGALADWDSDGDIDLGSGDHEGITGKFLGRSAAPISTNRGTDNVHNFRWTTIDSNTSEIRIGRFLWTATGGDGESLLDFKERLEQQGALWFQDGAVTPFDQTNGNVASNGPVSITIVPEPASLGLLALTGLGLIRRRK